MKNAVKVNTTGTTLKIKEMITTTKGGKFVSITYQNWSGNSFQVTARFLPNKGAKILAPDVVRMVASNGKTVDIPVERVRKVKVNGQNMEF